MFSLQYVTSYTSNVYQASRYHYVRMLNSAFASLLMHQQFTRIPVCSAGYIHLNTLDIPRLAPGYCQNASLPSTPYYNYSQYCHYH